MKGSYTAGTVSGISVKLHWTLVILFVWLFGLYVWRGASLSAAFTGVSLVALLFVCVALHELGHSFAARRFGIHTRDITLYPFGGIARLEGRAMKPVEELWVALAGPAVNLGIAAALYIVASSTGISTAADIILRPGGFLGTLMWLNLALALFNLIPAFPMDGGRVLRAGLATQMRYEAATQIAVFFGVVIAIVFMIVGLLRFNPSLVFVGLFVLLGATQESKARP